MMKDHHQKDVNADKDLFQQKIMSLVNQVLTLFNQCLITIVEFELDCDVHHEYFNLFLLRFLEIEENDNVHKPLLEEATYSFCQSSDGAPTCLGGGTCEEHDGTFTCYCPPGLAGDRCQHDLSQHEQISVASFLGSGEGHLKSTPSYVEIKTPSDIIR